MNKHRKHRRIWKSADVLCKVSVCAAMLVLLIFGCRNELYAQNETTIHASALGGRTLTSGTYRITGSASYEALDTQNALTIAPSSEVTLIIDGGTVSLTGGDAARWDKPGGAGIKLPSTSTLNIKGNGTLKVKGGDAENGKDGKNGYNSNGTSSAIGGNGGAGGAGAGAGIGSAGGQGGVVGKNGGSPSDSCGNIMIFDTVSVEAYGGSGGKGGNGGNGGTGTYLYMLVGWGAYGGGGGGAGGGGGYPAAAIGSGGAGGGGGTDGTSGRTDEGGGIALYSKPAYASPGYGGNGGGGYGGGGAGGTGGAGNVKDGYTAWKEAPTQGRSGGTFGSPGESSSYKEGSSGTLTEGGIGRHNLHVESVPRGGNPGANKYGNFSLYQSVQAKLQTKHGGASGVTSAGAVNIGSGGGATLEEMEMPVYLIYNLSLADATATPSEFIYSGKPNEPKITASYGGKTIPSDAYEITYDANTTSVGVKEAVIKGKAIKSTSYIYGEKKISYKVNKGKFQPYLKPSVPSIELGQTVNVSVENKLTEGKVTWHLAEGSKDAEISTINANTVVLTPKEVGLIELYADVEGNDTYEAATTEPIKISVTEQGIDNFLVEGIESKTYTGLPLTQENLVVKSGDQTLNPETDYDVAYEKNTEIGTATIVITGKGDKTGTIYATFQIMPIDIKEATIETPSDLVYSAQDQSAPLQISYQGRELTEGVDYEAYYSNTMSAGEVNVTIAGIGNFFNTASVSYHILPKALENCAVEMQAFGAFEYDGTQHKSSVSASADGNPLREGVDYEVSYSNNVNAGNAIATISGKGNYSGSASTTFEIGKRTLYVVPDADQWKYTGDEDAVFKYTFKNHVEGNEPVFDTSTSLGREEGEKEGFYLFKAGTLALDKNAAVNNNYKLEVESGVSFEIKPFEIDKEAILEGVKGDNDWYKSEVTLKAPDGYLIATSVDDEWKESIQAKDGDYSHGIGYYLKEIDRGYVSAVKTASFKQDSLGAVSRIILNGSKAWLGMYETPTFKTYFDDEVELGIYGDDELSGIQQTSYYLSSEILDESDLQGLADDIWKPIISDEFITVSDTDKHIVYVRMKDKAGNVTYGRSNGFIIDRDDPTIDHDYQYEDAWTSDKDAYIDVDIIDAVAGLKDRYVDYTFGDQSPQLIELDEDGKGKIIRLPDGDYNVTISARDNADNLHYVSVPVKKDTKEPTVSVSGDTKTYATEQEVHITQTTGASGLDKVFVQHVEEGAAVNADGSWEDITAEYRDKESYTARANGTYYFRVQSVVGTYSKPAEISFTRIDRTKPEVSVELKNEDQSTYTNESWTNQSVRLAFTNGKENLGTSVYEISLDGGTTWTKREPVNGYVTQEFEASGEYKVGMRITSNANVVSEEIFVTIRIDKGKPQAQMKVRENKWRYFLKQLTFNQFYKDTMDVSVETDDGEGSSGVDTIQFFVYSGDQQTLERTAPKSIEELEYLVSKNGGWSENKNSYAFAPNDMYNIVYAKITDVAGNVTYVSSDGFALDGSGPEITFVENGLTNYGEAGKWFTDKNSTLTVMLEDSFSGLNLDRVQCTVDGKQTDIKIENDQFVLSGLPEGSGYEVEVKAEDAVGNVSTESYFVYKDTMQPKAVVSADTENYAVRVNAEVQAEAGASGIGKVEYRFLPVGEHQVQWTDITDSYETPLKITENGTLHVRVTNKLGIRSEVTTTIFDKIEQLDAKAVVWLEDENKEQLGEDEWLNGSGSIAFSNEPANVRGFTYEIKVDNGAWQTIDADEHGVARLNPEAGQHTYTVRVNNGAEYSDDVQIQAKADVNAPAATLELRDNADGNRSLADTDKITEGNYIQQFYGDEAGKMIYLKNLVEKEEESGLRRISYYAQRSSKNTYLEEIPDTPEAIEKLVDGSWGSYSANQWENELDGETEAPLPAVFRMNYSYVYYVKVEDVAGNVTYLSLPGFAFDNNTPEIQLAYPEGTWLNPNSDPLKASLINSIGGVGSASYEVNGTSYTVDAGLLRQGSFPIDISKLSDGENTVVIKAANRLNVEAQPLSATVLMEREKPKIEVNGEADDPSLSRRIEVQAESSYSPIRIVEMKVNDGEWQPLTDWQDGIEVDKNATYAFQAVSIAGNRSEVKSVTYSKIDSEEPMVATQAFEKDEDEIIDEYQLGTWTDKNVELTISNVKKNYGKSTVEVRNAQAPQWEPIGELKDTNDEQSITLKDTGKHGLEVRIRSQLGAVSKNNSVDVRIDKEAPKLQSQLQTEDWTNQPLEVNIAASDPLSGMDKQGYSFDGGNSFQEQKSQLVYANGTVELAARDAVGNISRKTVEVSNLDTLTPDITQIEPSTEDWAKSKLVKAVVFDQDKTEESGSSGIDYVFLTSHNPYSGMSVKRVEPADDDILMRPQQTRSTQKSYVTSTPVKQYIGNVEEDNYWVVAVDTAGNANATSLCLNKIDGIRQPQPDDPVKPDTPDDEQKEPNTPDQDKPSNDAQQKPGSDSGDDEKHTDKEDPKEDGTTGKKPAEDTKKPGHDNVQDIIDESNQVIQGAEQNSTAQQTVEEKKEQKKQLTELLDKIEGLLKEDLSQDDRQTLEKKKVELLENLVEVLCKEDTSDRESLRLIEQLLKRDDLTQEQRTALETRKKALEEELRFELLMENDYAILILCIGACLMITGGTYAYVRKKKKEGRES